MATTDTTKPVLTSLVLPKTIDVTKADVRVTATVGATDAGLGVDFVSIRLDSNYQSTYGRSSTFFLSGSTDPFADGRSSTTEVFTRDTASGTYGIEAVTVYDKAGNYTIYDKDDLVRLGFQTSFTVKGAVADTTKPVLTSLALPKTIDVTKTDVSVTATVGATDAGLGVDFVSIRLDSNYQSTYGRSSTFYFSGSTDPFSDGRSSTTEVFTRDTASGTYGIETVTVYDKAGNYTIYDKDDLIRLGFQTSFTVKGAVADTTKPVLTSLVLPKTVDISQGNTEVTASVGATDSGLGVDFVSIRLSSSYQSTYGRSSTFYFSGSTDPFSDGRSSTTEVFTRDTAPGTYGIETVTVYDKAGNYTIYDRDDLIRLGFQTSFTVTDVTKINGTSGDDALTGTETANIINGLAGADTMKGLGGNDVYYVDTLGDRVIEAAGKGSDKVLTSVSYALQDGQEIETFATTDRAGTAALALTGNAFAQSLTGNAGDNHLDGGGGADTMTGLGGNDTYLVDSAGDRVVEAFGQGQDTVLTSVSYALQAGQEIEALAAADKAGTAGLSLTGSAYAQSIRGNAGDNRLDGGGGADTLTGLGGNDTYLVDNAGDRVVETFGQGQDTVLTSVSYTLQAGQGIEALAAADQASRTALTLTGNAYAQTLTGNAGANRLDGGSGADTMAGLRGNDTYHVDHVGDRVVEAAGEGWDVVLTRVSFALQADQEIEAFATAEAGSTAALALTGNAYAQTLTGNAGDNRLDGGGGADKLVGLFGNDTYYVDHAGDRVVEAVGQGRDTVRTQISYTLQAEQEIEALAAADKADAAALTLVGNEFGQALTGNAGHNTLDGRGGADTMAGLDGDDLYVVDEAGDRIVEAMGQGRDTVLTSISYALQAGQEVEALAAASLTGTAALNLTGNAFGQSLTGNAGSNILKGLGGSDTFLFQATLSARNVDRIADFTVSSLPDHDAIQLSKAVFATLDVGSLAEHAFKDLATVGATVDADDRILYDARTGALAYDADGSGTGAKAVTFAVLDNRAALTHADLFVV
ncbi:calcium-binding protein [Methylobacterium sp. Leaf118]|uniref:calcium-binding protein n=1 Tax=Methylobacterium sp. Leaf118 TaxID=2876562 RepID=UPI001E4FB55A|nr:calcium-binding protein [Methylobacterium sp. Leaf118]